MTPSPTPSTSLQRPALEYQQLMRDGLLCSEELVSSFLDQIHRHNHDGLELRAITSVCPRDVALSQARKLDNERRRGEIRSELHGIPIVIKVRSLPSLTLLRADHPTDPAYLGCHCHRPVPGHGDLCRLVWHRRAQGQEERNCRRASKMAEFLVASRTIQALVLILFAASGCRPHRDRERQPDCTYIDLGNQAVFKSGCSSEHRNSAGSSENEHRP